MRILVSGLLLAVTSLPCAAQTVLKSEPLMLAPFEVALIRDGSCSVGKVLKVTGSVRGLPRKRTCVAQPNEQASLVSATP